MTTNSLYNNNDGIQLEKFGLLLKESEDMIFDPETPPQFKYKEKKDALGIIYDGYTTLPQTYHDVFLNPLKEMMEKQDYSILLRNLDSNGGPWLDWLSAVHQRLGENYPEHIQATHAFEECMADLYDGFLSMEERRGIKLPDHQVVSPLVKWGRPEWGPYVWPANVGGKIGMKMSVVSMPPAYSRNIALWAALGHETGGHAILHADDGLLREIGDIVEKKIIDAPQLDGHFATVNGRKVPLKICASAYWKYTIDETASDVCGILNLGPAAGVGLATLLIPLRRGMLTNASPSADVHPIDSLRMLLAADVVRDLPDLYEKRAKAWADILEDIVKRYSKDQKKDFRLYTETFGGDPHWDDIMPYDAMRSTVKLVAEAIAFSPLNALEGHHLSEVNTWSNADEDLAWRIMGDLMDGKEPCLEQGPDGQDVYASHLLAGAIIASARTGQVSKTTESTIKALNRLYENNPVWLGFPVRFRSDAHLHKMVSAYGKDPRFMPED
jgi:hypothetical protein